MPDRYPLYVQRLHLSWRKRRRCRRRDRLRAGGFVGVLMMIALAGIIGAALSRGISETA